MAYHPILSPQARKDLASFSGPMRQHIVAALRMLAADPVGLSSPSFLPYPPDCLLFRPNPFFDDRGRHEFMALFRYGQDEVSLQIIGIGHYVLE
jgi:hypothetical protein